MMFGIVYLVTNWGGGENMEFRTCPSCNSVAESEDASYCFNCGAYIINRCTNKDCPSNDVEYLIELPTHHNFCVECGSKTLFGEIRESNQT